VADYPDEATQARFFDRFADRLATALGARVSFSSWPLFADFPEQAIEVDGREGHVVRAGAVGAGAGYFDALGIRLRSGRGLTLEDATTAAPVAVVSESLARRLWPEGTALGRQLRQVEVAANGPRPPGPWRTVVGVAADVRQSYGDENLRDVYTPWRPASRYGTFATRTDLLPAVIHPRMRAVAAEIDPTAIVELPVRGDEGNRELSGARFLTTMLAAFAGVAVFVAVLGIYTVTAYAARQREREVAIRIALGAEPRGVLRLFLGDALLMLGPGLCMGVAGAVAAARVLQHQVYAVQAFDPATLAIGSLTLAAIGVAATWWPARRASRVSPVSVLKES
jgi:putative ABC transport system permease protein